jgi:hypothetical protein
VSVSDHLKAALFPGESHCCRGRIRIALATERRRHGQRSRDGFKTQNRPGQKEPEDYRGLADRVREAAHRVSNERQRADLLAMAKIWDS